MTPAERLIELFAKVDAFFDRASSAFPGPDGITCSSGCDDCCRRRLTITRIEADAIASALAGLGDDARRALAGSIDRSPEACAALVHGRCSIYGARPLVCRTHGLPIRFREAGDRRALPLVDACPRNFGGRELAGLPPGSVLDQATLSTVLGALDAARADEAAAPRGERVDLAEHLRRALA